MSLAKTSRVFSPNALIRAQPLCFLNHFLLRKTKDRRLAPVFWVFNAYLSVSGVTLLTSLDAAGVVSAAAGAGVGAAAAAEAAIFGTAGLPY